MRKKYPFIDCCIKTISKMKLSKGNETDITKEIADYFKDKHSGIAQGEVKYNSLIKDFKISSDLSQQSIKQNIRCDLAYWSESVLNILELKIFDDQNFKGWHLSKAYCMLLIDYLKGEALKENKSLCPKTVFWQVVILLNPQKFEEDLIDDFLLNHQWKNKNKKAPYKYDSPFGISVEAIKRLAENDNCEVKYVKVPKKLASGLKILVIKRDVN